MSIVYEEATIMCPDSEFTFYKELTANLKIWEDDVEPELITKTWKQLEGRGESIRVALKYLGNRQIIVKKMDYSTYYYNSDKFTLRDLTETDLLIKYLRGEIKSYATGISTIEFVSEGLCIALPIPLPKTMPFIPLELHGMAETLTIATELVNCPDLRLKLAYLILEELMRGKPWSPDERNIRYARDFVSHSICDKNKKVIAFVEGELPSAKKSNNAVQFKRDEGDHIAFVSKYADLALQKAKDIFNEKVEKLGGCVRV